jgi:hypothetical protein
MSIIQKNKKPIAIALAAVILLTSVPLTIWGFGSRSTLTMENAGAEDKRIASEISNETGASLKEIFELKENGRTWNEVLSVLKTSMKLGQSGKKNDRAALLLTSGLDEDFIKKLKKEGFKEQDINEVKLLAERVTFELQEITDNSKNKQNQDDNANKDQGTKNNIQNPTTNIGSGSTSANNTAISSVDIKGNKAGKEDISAYEELAKKLDTKNAIYFMLKIKTDFGGYEQVFDEYLFSLQAELDLNDYIKDKKAYEKKKEEKKLVLDPQKVITLEKIEQKSLEKTQNESDSEQPSQKNSTEKATGAAGSKDISDKSPLPDVPKPDAGSVKPQNPTDEVMNEINQINPMADNKKN